MTEIYLKNLFKTILGKEGIYKSFIKDFGNDFWAKSEDDDGWHVDIDDKGYYYVESDVYGDYSDG